MVIGVERDELVVRVVRVVDGFDQPLTAPTVMPLTKYFWTNG